MDENIFSPGPREQTVRDASGTVHSVPKGWILLPPGDAALTRRTKAAGKFWTVQEKKGRKVFSKGIYAPAETIAKLQKGLESERSTERYAKQKEAATKRREKNAIGLCRGFSRGRCRILAVRTQIPFSLPGTSSSGFRSRDTGGKWYRGSNQEDPDRATGRGRRHRLDEASDDGLRSNEDRSSQRDAPRGSPHARRAVSRAVEWLSFGA